MLLKAKMIFFLFFACMRSPTRFQLFGVGHWTRRLFTSPRAIDFSCENRLLLPVDGAQYVHVMEAAAVQSFAAVAGSSSSQIQPEQMQEVRAAAAAQ